MTVKLKTKRINEWKERKDIFFKVNKSFLKKEMPLGISNVSYLSDV